MKLLVLTPEWPDLQYPTSGVFVSEQVASLRRRGIEVEVLPFRGLGRPDRYVRILGILKKRLSAGTYDLLHAHFGQAGFLATRQKLTATVVTFHGSDVFGLPGNSLRDQFRSYVLRSCSQIAARRCDTAIAVSASVKMQIPRPDACVVPMGVDLAAFCPGSKSMARKELGWQADLEVVLFVGDPENRTKRFDLAQRVVDLVRGRHPRADLKVCWGVAREQVPLYYRAADLLLVTSSHEGGPISIYEALATNLPVVSVDVGSARPRLSGLAGAAVVENGTEAELANAVVTCLERSERFLGRDSVEDLGQDAVAERLEQIYLRTLGRPSAGGLQRS